MRGLIGPERDLLLEACKLAAEGSNREIEEWERPIVEALVRQGRLGDNGGSWEITPAGREALRIDAAIGISAFRYE